MRKKIISVLLILFLSFVHQSGNTQDQKQRLKIFVDCSNTFCDMNFVKTEITLVDFLLDRLAADVHVLITEQETGSGGSQYQLIFFGQNTYNKLSDTLRFNTDPNATSFEERDLLIKYLKLGLTPYVVRAGSGNGVTIEMKQKEGEKVSSTPAAPTRDPWNYWVYRVGLNGHFDADANYKSSRTTFNLVASRVTEEWKIVFEAYAGRNSTTFNVEDDLGNEEKIKIRNDDYTFEHYLIKSLAPHWSFGYEVGLSRNSFSNNKSRALLRTGIEYAIFPYKEVNTKYFTVSYLLDARRNTYFDTTLYDKTSEMLYGHGIETDLSFNQKWGTIGFGAEYHNYFHNWKFFNLNVNAEVDIRITGGLSFNIYTSASLTRDQLFLPKAGATAQEVLTRRRQLASGYSLFTSFGINYRFGSKLNNFVNPRFN
ncbi:MAG: hypothetical protein H7Y42_16765 [Chitinophagaceae bacterium]|nr:hypothetical protein [Chitinophagaceae bacterium]